MNTLIILSILIGHLWADRAQAQKPTQKVKGLITNAAVPKAKRLPKSDNHSASSKASKDSGAMTDMSTATLADKSSQKLRQAGKQISQEKHAASKAETTITKKAEPVQKLIPLEPSKKIEAGKSKATIEPSDTKASSMADVTADKQPAPTAAPIKEAPSQEEVPAKDEAKEADKLEVSIDTVGIEAGGNWLNKRVWYEHAQDALQDIANELSNILATRQQYLTARDTLDDKLEEAFIEFGFDQGKLAQLLDQLLESLKEEQQERGDLSAQERKLRLNIEKQQKDLEQLKLDLESLKNLDDSLDAAVKRVMEQINLAGMYNKEAHSHFDQIPNVHEQRAKELYYKIDTLNKDMLAIKAYLTGQLSDYLKQVENSANMHIAKIKSEIAAIQAKGIDFKKQLRILEGEDQEVIERREAEREEAEEEEPGFFGRTWNWITSWF